MPLRAVCVRVSRSNPYQKNLMEGLRKLGVYVEGSLLTEIKGKPDVVHIHWLRNYYLGRNAIHRILKLLRFMGLLLALRMKSNVTPTPVLLM